MTRGEKRLELAVEVDCPVCGASLGTYCKDGPIRIRDSRGLVYATLHPAREEQAVVAREIAASIVPPSRGGIYWCPGDTLPPPVTITEDGFSVECAHDIEPGDRRCACACVRLPPVAFRVRLLAFKAESREVRGVDGIEWENLPALVLRVDAPAAARAYYPGPYSRDGWDQWECCALGIEGPDGTGLWAWNGVLTVGWRDDDPDNYGENFIDEPDLRWDGEWRRVEWPSGWNDLVEPPP